ncbi:hypothetical protein [Sphingomonas profundi]|uniref:hypothetical protein n=1 Tax=Alterirhizorhabdus profundi TaxID=2681549 RepID=UPI0012E96589|nr:hypothetical protein [Sphingomonas profundi]
MRRRWTAAYDPRVTIHRPIHPPIHPRIDGRPERLIGEIALAPADGAKWSPRWRIAVILLASAWLWIGIGTLAELAIG